MDNFSAFFAVESVVDSHGLYIFDERFGLQSQSMVLKARGTKEFECKLPFFSNLDVGFADYLQNTHGNGDRNYRFNKSFSLHGNLGF